VEDAGAEAVEGAGDTEGGKGRGEDDLERPREAERGGSCCLELRRSKRSSSSSGERTGSGASIFDMRFCVWVGSWFVNAFCCATCCCSGMNEMLEDVESTRECVPVGRRGEDAKGDRATPAPRNGTWRNLDCL
jgi:hypothetical protein